jgi:putative transposase
MQNSKFNNNNSFNQVWQNGNHLIELQSPKFFRQKLDYIHLNPVRAGWVKKPEEYLYSSATNYITNTGLIEVTILDLPLSDIGYVGV